MIHGSFVSVYYFAVFLLKSLTLLLPTSESILSVTFLPLFADVPLEFVTSESEKLFAIVS